MHTGFSIIASRLALPHPIAVVLRKPLTQVLLYNSCGPCPHSPHLSSLLQQFWPGVEWSSVLVGLLLCFREGNVPLPLMPSPTPNAAIFTKFSSVLKLFYTLRSLSLTLTHAPSFSLPNSQLKRYLLLSQPSPL